MTNFDSTFSHVCGSSNKNHRFTLLGKATINASIMMKISRLASIRRMKSEFVPFHYLFMINWNQQMIFNQQFAHLAVSNSQCAIIIRFSSIISFFFLLFRCSLNDFESRHIPVLMLELEKKLLQFHLGFH